MQLGIKKRGQIVINTTTHLVHLRKQISLCLQRTHRKLGRLLELYRIFTWQIGDIHWAWFIPHAFLATGVLLVFLHLITFFGLQVYFNLGIVLILVFGPVVIAKIYLMSRKYRHIAHLTDWKQLEKDSERH